MDNIFTTKSLIKMINSECNRVINNKLASLDDVKSVVNPILQKDMSNLALGSIHSKLSSVKLPGDFKKAFFDINNLMQELLPTANDLGDGEILVVELTPNLKETSVKEDDEKCKCDNKDCKCDEEVELPTDNDTDSATDQVSVADIEQLKDIAYKLGSSGNHEAALKIERQIDLLNLLLNK